MLAAGVSGLARAHGWKAANDRPITAHNVWAALAHRDLALPALYVDCCGTMCLSALRCGEEAAWLAFIEALLPLFSPAPQGSEGDVADFCTFVAEQKADLADPERRSTKQVQFDDLTLRLGSIHSVKGKSVDGILVLESEIWKGNSADEQCIDLAAVLPRAFGVTDELFTGVRLTAATNVFVGVTRPRELLGLALRKSEAMVLIGPPRTKVGNLSTWSRRPRSRRNERVRTEGPTGDVHQADWFDQTYEARPRAKPGLAAFRGAVGANRSCLSIRLPWPPPSRGRRRLGTMPRRPARRIAAKRSDRTGDFAPGWIGLCARISFQIPRDTAGSQFAAKVGAGIAHLYMDALATDGGPTQRASRRRSIPMRISFTKVAMRAAMVLCSLRRTVRSPKMRLRPR